MKNHDYNQLLTEMNSLKEELRELYAENDRLKCELVHSEVESEPVNCETEDDACQPVADDKTDGLLKTEIEHCQTEAESARIEIESLHFGNESMLQQSLFSKSADECGLPPGVAYCSLACTRHSLYLQFEFETIVLFQTMLKKIYLSWHSVMLCCGLFHCQMHCCVYVCLRIEDDESRCMGQSAGVDCDVSNEPDTAEPATDRRCQTCDKLQNQVSTDGSLGN